jgi:hypothetical protein
MENINTLKKKLVESGFSKESVDKMSKGELLKKISDMETEGLSLDNIISENEVLVDTITEKVIPSYGDEGWEEYVMSQFAEKELFDSKYPRLNGLRRVALKLLGRVLSSGPVKLERNWDGTGSAYCIYELEFEHNIRFSAIGDASPYNMDDVYNIYPSLIAENRAEARAYRKALLLSVVAAEEVKENKESFTSVLSTTVEYNDQDPISAQQETIIKTKCKQLNLNYETFIKDSGIVKPTRKDAIELINKLNNIQQGI